VKGYLDQRWSEWFYGLTITNTESSEAVLSGTVSDQAALHGRGIKVWDLGLPMIEVHCVGVLAT